MKNKNLVRVSVIVLAAAFIVLGVMRGEHDLVLKKAINVCLECIGVG